MLLQAVPSVTPRGSLPGPADGVLLPAGGAEHILGRQRLRQLGMLVQYDMFMLCLFAYVCSAVPCGQLHSTVT